MRLLCLLVLVAGLLAGCARGRRPSALPPAPGPAPVVTVPSATTNVSGVIVTPGGVVPGKVVSVNPTAKLVVLSFPIGGLPPTDRRVSVYRQGLKVGELKITGPQRDNNTVADIVAGECRVGDEVKED